MKPSGAHTHPSSGSSLPVALVVIVAAAIAATVAGPVVNAIAALLRAVILIGAVTIALAVAALIAWVVYRARHPRPWLAGRAGPPHLSTAPRRAALGEASPPVIHLHLHGTSPQDVAEVLARHLFTIDSHDGGDRYATP